MSEGIDINAPKRTKRVSNRIGLSEVDEDGTRWLSSGKVYTCRGSVSVIEEESDK